MPFAGSYWVFPLVVAVIIREGVTYCEQYVLPEMYVLIAQPVASRW